MMFCMFKSQYSSVQLILHVIQAAGETILHFSVLANTTSKEET